MTTALRQINTRHQMPVNYAENIASDDELIDCYESDNDENIESEALNLKK